MTQLLNLFFIGILIQQALAPKPALAQQSNEYGFQTIFNNIYIHQDTDRNAYNMILSLYVDTHKVISVIGAQKFACNLARCGRLYLSIQDKDGEQEFYKEIKVRPRDTMILSTSYLFTNAIVKLNNGNYMISVESGHDSTEDGGDFLGYTKHSYYIFDSNGDSVAFTALRDSGNVIPNSLAVDKDGYVVSMATASFVNWDSLVQINIDGELYYTYYHEKGIRLIKLNQDGEILWQRRIEESVLINGNIEEYYGFGITPDATKYVIALNKIVDSMERSEDSISLTNPAVYITDSSGKWLRTIWIPHSSPATDSIAQDPKYRQLYNLEFDRLRITVGADGYIYYLMSEYVPEYDPIFTPYILVSNKLHYGKMDTAGNIIWRKEFSFDRPTIFPIVFSSIATAANNDLVISASVNDKLLQADKGLWDHLVIRADSSGNVKWHKKIHLFDQKEGYNGTVLSVNQQNGRIGVGGRMHAAPLDPNSDASELRKSLPPINYGYLVVMDSLGRRCPADTAYGEISAPDCPFPTLLIDPVLTSDAEINVYPNPTSGRITVFIKELPKLYPGSECILFDVMGRKLLQNTLTLEKQYMELGHLPSGNYIIKILHKDKVLYTGKIAKY